MKFREYIRQMDEEELVHFFANFAFFETLCCTVCPFFYDDSCIVDSEHCSPAVKNLLDRDVEDPVFDDFF